MSASSRAGGGLRSRPPLLQVRGFRGGGRQRLRGNFPRSVYGDKSRAGGLGTQGPAPRGGSQPGRPASRRGLGPPRGSGSVAVLGEGCFTSVRRVGSKGAGGLSVNCLRSGAGVKTLRRRGRERGGRRCAPAAGAGGGCGGRGDRPLGPRGWVFCLAPLPLPSELGRPPGGRDCSLQVSDPHALLPKGAPGAPRLLPRLCSPPPRRSGSPAPPPAEDGCPGLRGGR